MSVDTISEGPLVAVERPTLRGAGYSPGDLFKVINKNKFYYLMALPGLLYFLVFHYLPMFGIIVAFKDITPFSGLDGILHEPFVGFIHFKHWIQSYYFTNVMGNTLVISGLKLLFGFPTPIILALLINEVRNTKFKRTVQTISYMPHFLSAVVVSGLVMNLLSSQGGLVNQAVVGLGGTSHAYLTDPRYFRAILVSSHVWQHVGWGTILYLAAMSGIDPQLYEAAMIDGANKLQQIRHITLPGITFVIVILLIFAIGGLLNAGFEQILLLYSPAVYSVSDIIDTYVYRSGLLSMQYSFATAVGVFKSILAMTLLLGANWIARRLGQTGIW
jgi:putative aldouronate transport system permease protein